MAHWALWRRKLYTWWRAGASGGTGVSGGAGFGVVVVSVAAEGSLVDTGFSGVIEFIG
jgi:hypothetical protein